MEEVNTMSASQEYNTKELTDVLVVKVDSRHGRATEILKSHDGALSVGRGFRNDVIMTDPYVSDNQLIFNLQEGRWFVDILNQTNPVLINGEPVVDASVEVHAGDKLTIGRSNLVIYSEDHLVDDTRKLLLSSWLYHHSAGVILPFIVLVLISVFDGYMDYMQFSLDHKWQGIASDVMVTALVIVVWSGIWSIAGRLFRHQSHFSLQLLMSTLVYSALVIIYPIATYIAYVFSSLLVGQIIAYTIGFIVASCLLKVNLFFATNIGNSTKTAISVSFVLALFVYALANFSDEDFSPVPAYSKSLKPPLSHITHDQTISSYFNNVEDMLESM